MKFSIAITALLLAPAVSASAQTFESVTPPPAPDYARPESWAARPGAAGASAALAPGATPAVRDAGVDVFYVHPTTFGSKDAWNQNVADRTTNAWTDASVIARQAGIFNGCCRVFAPRYRQAAGRAVMLMDGEGGKAFALAYQDVERAFLAYLSKDNHGRPFILVGHSQGAAHIATLLERRIDGTPLAKRMVAAYVIGFNLSEGDFGTTFKTLHLCDRPAQTGCVVAWNSVLPEANRIQLGAAMEQRYIKRHGDDPGKTLACTNPLTFDRRRGAAPATASRGAVPGDPGAGPIAPLRAGAVAARCADGFLVVEPAAALGLKALPGGSLHYHDLGLFYADIRANARLRSNTYLKAHMR